MDRERRNEAGRPDERAQLTVDYLVGTVTFLLVVGFVFSFVPEMLVPFTSGQPAHPAVADRTATTSSRTASRRNQGFSMATPSKRSSMARTTRRP